MVPAPKTLAQKKLEIHMLELLIWDNTELLVQRLGVIFPIMTMESQGSIYMWNMAYVRSPSADTLIAREGTFFQTLGFMKDTRSLSM